MNELALVEAKLRKGLGFSTPHVNAQHSISACSGENALLVTLLKRAARKRDSLFSAPMRPLSLRLPAEFSHGIREKL